ncbi:MAG: response regulator [Desulfotignum sp.]|jgi:PAS domain S-box-containing protein|nr:response regulator [Desulfotignum sp.]
MPANKILIVDDEQVIVRLLSMSLKSDGYETFSAFSGEEALDVFKEHAPDIVVTDIKMPGMDGLELLKKIKELDPEKEVIIVTGHGDIDSTITALQFGASDFINKPVRDEALAIALDRAKTKISIREQLASYTHDLEDKVAEATREIRRKSNFQRLLIHSSHDAIVAFDQDWQIVVYNPEAAKIFGKKPGDVLGKMTIDELYTPELAQYFRKEAENKANDRDMPWQEMILETRSKKQIPVRYATNVLHEKKEFMGIVNFFQDLTEIKRLEKELIQSERMAAVGQTVSGLAHYVKNILIGLKGGSYVVDVGLQNNNMAKLTTGWLTIKKNIKRVADLTQDMLTYSKERKPETEPCFPNEIVDEVVDLVTDFAASHNIHISKICDPELGEMVLDPRTIHRALLNLVNNAIEACLELEEENKKFVVEISTKKGDDGSALFAVKDNGIGMDEETRTKLFTPMFSSKGGKGTGLGLLVTKKLVEEHGGTIDIDTSLGYGSVFTMRLPEQPGDSRNGNNKG